MKKSDLRLALLIDAENACFRDLDHLIQKCGLLGDIFVRRIYGDWRTDNLKPWHKLIADFALDARQVMVHETGKNSCDIALVVDAMDLLHTVPLDGFIVMSSDSDYIPLALRIRAAGKKFYGAGRSGPNNAFVNACTDYFALAPKTSQKSKSNTSDLSAIPELVSHAMEAIPDRDGWFPLSQVSAKMREEVCGFSHKNYGASTIKKLLERLEMYEFSLNNGTCEIRLG